MKFERDERKFDFHDIGLEIKRKREAKGMTQGFTYPNAFATSLAQKKVLPASCNKRIEPNSWFSNTSIICLDYPP